MRYYLVICIVSCVCLNADAFALDGSEVLENLRLCDAIYEAGFTASGTWKHEDRLCALVPVDVQRAWRFTFDAGRCGYLKEVLEYDKPKFQEPVGRRGSLTEDGWLVLSIRTRQWGYWGDTLSGNHYGDTVIKVSSANEIVEIGEMHNSSLFGPNDAGPNVPKRTVLWSLGRLFSKRIDEITQVEKSDDGLITVSALGRKGEGQPGRWELEIEPAAAWIVRKARYYPDSKPDLINCEMTNSGTVRTGPYCIPRKALFNYFGPLEGGNLKPNELIFDPVIEQFDKKLYSDAEQAVTINRPPKLTIHDYRVSPPFVYQPDELSEFERKRLQWLEKKEGGMTKWGSDKWMKSPEYYQRLETPKLAEECFSDPLFGFEMTIYNDPMDGYLSLETFHNGFAELFRREDMWKGILHACDFLSSKINTDSDLRTIVRVSNNFMAFDLLYRLSPLKSRSRAEREYSSRPTCRFSGDTGSIWMTMILQHSAPVALPVSSASHAVSPGSH